MSQDTIIALGVALVLRSNRAVLNGRKYLEWVDSGPLGCWFPEPQGMPLLSTLLGLHSLQVVCGCGWQHAHDRKHGELRHMND